MSETTPRATTLRSATASNTVKTMSDIGFTAPELGGVLYAWITASEAIYYSFGNDAADANGAFYLAADTLLTLEGEANIQRFSCIRATTNDALVHVQLGR